MWYPFLGCILTVSFSLIVSQVDSMLKYRTILRITNAKELELSQPKPLKGLVNNSFSKE